MRNPLGRSERRGHEKRAGRAGFTLTELMIVVSIIGVLATIAVVSYRKMINASKTTEATRIVQAIRLAQESYSSAVGQYANISTSLDGTLCPAVAHTYKTPWDSTCSGGVDTWNRLTLETDGPVLFRYATMAGLAGTLPGAAPAGLESTPNFGAVAMPANWFTVAAKGDTDGNGTLAVVVGTSWTNQLYIDRDGE
ncbi:MAG: prepilin-type N-terminal cleavage/methylation domain-containing protein [Polyangiaceae bacterium]|nr:prepilin-type N-terminal cleavage/methylation domain-containing protein [Polyangiaceae bacterium]